jgi:hypothetical protein
MLTYIINLFTIKVNHVKIRDIENEAFYFIDRDYSDMTIELTFPLTLWNNNDSNQTSVLNCHHQPINVSTAGAQAFLMDCT